MAVPARVVVLLLSSGAGVAYVFEHREQLLELLGGEAAPSARGDGAHASAVRELTRIVDSLAERVRHQQQRAPAPATAVHVLQSGDASSGAGGPLSRQLWPVGIGALLASAALLYARRNALRNLLWVSRSRFEHTLGQLQDTVDSLSQHVGTLREELAVRVTRVERRVVDDQSSLARRIEEQVGDARGRVADVGSRVDNVQGVVDGLERRLAELRAKISYANRGIVLLCSVVAALPPPTAAEHGGRGGAAAPSATRASRAWEELRRFVGGSKMSPPPPPLAPHERAAPSAPASSPRLLRVSTSMNDDDAVGPSVLLSPRLQHSRPAVNGVHSAASSQPPKSPGVYQSTTAAAAAANAFASSTSSPSLLKTRATAPDEGRLRWRQPVLTPSMSAPPS